MGYVKALSDRDAIKKMQHIAQGEIAMLCTVSEHQTMSMRPMATLLVDEHGVFWFMSQRWSTKNKLIAETGRVELCYAVPGKSAYMSIHGTATVEHDQKKIDELWSPLAKTWFPAGKDDPNITLIKVTAICGHYWDTKRAKMVQLAAVAVGALTGRPIDDGVQGALRV